MQAIESTATVSPNMHAAQRHVSWRAAPVVGVLTSLVLLQLSCDIGEVLQPDPTSSQGGTGVGAEPSPVEHFGTWITTARSTDIAWSADGTDIFHFAAAATCSSIEAVDIRDRSTRVVTDSLCGPSRLRLSADGSALFYQIIDQITDDNARSRIYRVPSGGGASEMLVERVLARYLPFGALQPMTMNTSYAVSADGSAIAYLTTGDSLYVLDAADQAARAFATGYSGSGEVVAFSPDGTEIVHNRALSGPLATTSLLDGSTRAISDQWNIRGLRWQAGEIHILDLTAEGHLYDRNLTTGQGSRIAEFDQDALLIAWSADGTRVASWVRRGCTASTGDWVMSRCTAWWFTLHLIDARSQTTTQIGQGNFGNTRGPGRPVFSADGDRIAYTVWSRSSGLYTSAVYVEESP